MRHAAGTRHTIHTMRALLLSACTAAPAAALVPKFEYDAVNVFPLPTELSLCGGEAVPYNETGAMLSLCAAIRCHSVEITVHGNARRGGYFGGCILTDAASSRRRPASARTR